MGAFLFVQTGFSQSFFMLTDTTQLVHYYTNGSIDSEIDEIISGYIDQLQNVEVFEKTAAVFDIDETTLSNFEYYRSSGFTWTQEGWNKWTLGEGSKVIPQTYKLYSFLVQRGIKIIFITGRLENEFPRTLRNLYDQGYTEYDTLICKPESLNHLTAQEYKTQTRQQLTEKGYTIIVNVGDQFSDILGANSGLRIKLPNYIYYIR